MSQAPAPPLLRFFLRPGVALLLTAGLFVLGLRFARTTPITRWAPFGDVVPLYIAGCLVVVAGARRWPRHRDLLNAVVGTAWLGAACGVHTTAALLAVALVVHYGSRRLDSHLAMLGTAVVVLVAFKLGALERRPVWALGALGGAGVFAVIAVAMAASRLCYYAFEARALRRDQRSLLAMLAYSPLGILLWTGNPALISFMTYRTRSPAADRDRLASRQLYQSGFKLIGFALGAQLLVWLLPTIGALPHLSLTSVCAVVYLVYLTTFCAVSGTADFACAVSNLAGYHAPNAFVWPLLAVTPFQYWRRWNVHVLDFLRRVFIYPVAKRRRSMVWLVAAGMTGTILYHTFLLSTTQGRKMTPLANLADQGLGYLLMGVVLVAAIPLEARSPRWTLPARVLAGIGWQALFALAHFAHLIRFYNLPGADSSVPFCLLWSWFEPTRSCLR